jgi:GNAT superfamily N-acetyltransferase
MNSENPRHGPTPPATPAPWRPASPGAAPDLNLLERWLSGWSLARGLPLPRREDGGLVVDVGLPDQLRRHVFADAGPALRECAARINEPLVFIKACVDGDTLRRALPPPWIVEAPRYLMRCDGPMREAAPPAAYTIAHARRHGAAIVHIVDTTGAIAASGQLVVHGATAIFDQIETAPAHRRRGLGLSLMGALDALARQAGVDERLLVATDAGRQLYLRLGWQVLAEYSTAVLPAAPFGAVSAGTLQWRHGAANASAMPLNIAPTTHQRQETP